VRQVHGFIGDRQHHLAVVEYPFPISLRLKFLNFRGQYLYPRKALSDLAPFELVALLEYLRDLSEAGARRVPHVLDILNRAVGGDRLILYRHIPEEVLLHAAPARSRPHWRKFDVDSKLFNVLQHRLDRGLCRLAAGQEVLLVQLAQSGGLWRAPRRVGARGFAMEMEGESAEVRGTNLGLGSAGSLSKGSPCFC
jgi:hypothetical protein